MKIVNQDLWATAGNPNTVYVVTTNATLRMNGSLVMGRGAAFEAKKRYGPQIEYSCGAKITRLLNDEASQFVAGPNGGSSLEQGTPLPVDDAFGYDPRFYGFTHVSSIHVEGLGTEEFGIFQVKHDWWEDAKPELIQRSALKLARIARNHPKTTFRMNFPGIGNGRLTEEQVIPLLRDLPDNVIVCRK